jgi:hypothetical protein
LSRRYRAATGAIVPQAARALSPCVADDAIEASEAAAATLADA